MHLKQFHALHKPAHAAVILGKSMRRFLLRFVVPPLLVIATVGAHIGYEIHSGNFHEVVKGEVYRSAQPTGADIVH